MAEPVDFSRPYVWSTTQQAWVNSGCGGCEFHVPDASPETTALLARLERELGPPELSAIDRGGREDVGSLS